VVHLTVSAGLHAPALARAFIKSAVEFLGSVAPEDAILLTSEAVTNSVVHAQTDAIEVSLYRDGDVVHVSVTDGDPGRPEVQDADPTRVGGFGVRLIDQLADDWGVEPIPGEGKTVWFEVALAVPA
jgi:anti-sigma regulatory factor (Ser/Thr protein kinase)